MSTLTGPSDTSLAVRTADLTAAGLSYHDISRDIRTGRRKRLHRGVLTQGTPAAEALSLAAARAAAALLVVPNAAVSHRSAGVLHRFLTADPESIVCVTRSTSTGCRRRAEPARVHLHTAALRRPDMVEVDGLAVTSAARTVCDLARLLPMPDALAAADAAVRNGCVTVEDMAEVLAAQVRWPGTVAARRVCAIVDPDAESPLESRVRATLVLLGGLPLPQLQVAVLGASGRTYRADLLWPDRWTLVEVDGRVKYDHAWSGSAQQALWAEKRRGDDLAEAGWEVVRIVADDLRHDHRRVTARVAAAFARGRRRHGGGFD